MRVDPVDRQQVDNALSTAAVQDQLRSLLWEELITSLKEERHDQPVTEELERLRVA
jgi:hypothetical protein